MQRCTEVAAPSVSISLFIESMAISPSKCFEGGMRGFDRVFDVAS